MQSPINTRFLQKEGISPRKGNIASSKQIVKLSTSVLKYFKPGNQKLSFDVVLLPLLVTLNIFYTLFHCSYCFERVFVWWGCINISIKIFQTRHPKDLTWSRSGAFISDFKHLLHFVPLLLLFWKSICLMRVYHLWMIFVNGLFLYTSTTGTIPCKHSLTIYLIHSVV